MKRYELSASQWRKIEGFLPGRPGLVGGNRPGQLPVRQWGIVDTAQWRPLEELACRVWQLAECPQTLHSLGQGWGMGTHLPGITD
jgi:hypothetical protein